MLAFLLTFYNKATSEHYFLPKKCHKTRNHCYKNKKKWYGISNQKNAQKKILHIDEGYIRFISICENFEQSLYTYHLM
jgi:hypothetical protein